MNGNKLKPKSLNLNPFLCKPYPIGPASQPDLFEPQNWAKNWVEPKNGSGLAARVLDLV